MRVRLEDLEGKLISDRMETAGIHTKIPQMVIWDNRVFLLQPDSPMEEATLPTFKETLAVAALMPISPAPVPTEEPAPVDRTAVTTICGTDPEKIHEVQQNPVGMHADYLVLTPEERRKGFVRPVRRSYQHVGPPGPRFALRDLTEDEQDEHAGLGYVKYEEYPESELPQKGRFWTQVELERIDRGCKAVTTMALSLAETYARDPHFYGATYCTACQRHIAVGPDGEFVWEGTDIRVGT